MYSLSLGCSPREYLLLLYRIVVPYLRIVSTDTLIAHKGCHAFKTLAVRLACVDMRVLIEVDIVPVAQSHLSSVAFGHLNLAHLDDFAGCVSHKRRFDP